MIERRPELVAYADGMPGGPDNPLGARAMYLFDDGRDTMFRIHGTNEPWSIGQNVSSGCIRMLNAHVEELYRIVDVGTKVIVM
jgi:lipoprotein-anchoring transpeptidase ErfK/SrfK